MQIFEQLPIDCIAFNFSNFPSQRLKIFLICSLFQELEYFSALIGAIRIYEMRDYSYRFKTEIDKRIQFLWVLLDVCPIFIDTQILSSQLGKGLYARERLDEIIFFIVAQSFCD